MPNRREETLIESCARAAKAVEDFPDWMRGSPTNSRPDTNPKRITQPSTGSYFLVEGKRSDELGGEWMQMGRWTHQADAVSQQERIAGAKLCERVRVRLLTVKTLSEIPGNDPGYWHD